MAKKITSALLIAKYAMAHDTDFEQIDILANYHGFIFHQTEDISWLRGQYGEYPRNEVLKAIKALGHDNSDIIVYTFEGCDGKRRLAFANLL